MMQYLFYGGNTIFDAAAQLTFYAGWLGKLSASGSMPAGVF